MKINASTVIGCCLGVLLTTSVHAQWSYTTAGATISENFNTMASAPLLGAAWTNNVTFVNWWQNDDTVPPNYDIDDGGDNSGDFKDYGIDNDADRAFGSLAASSFTRLFAVQIQNNTGTTLTEFTLNYVGEQWRNGGANVVNLLTFSYLVTSTAGNQLASAGYTNASALDFSSPINSVTSGQLNGNLAANRTAIGPSTITGLSWAAGDFLWLRWTDLDNTGADDGMAIDDLGFSGNVPAPGALALLGLAGLVGGRRRRR